MERTGAVAYTRKGGVKEKEGSFLFADGRQKEAEQNTPRCCLLPPRATLFQLSSCEGHVMDEQIPDHTLIYRSHCSLQYHQVHFG